MDPIPPRSGEPLPRKPGHTEVSTLQPLRPQLPETEASFYGHYVWAINPLSTIRELIKHLGEELHRCGEVEGDWRLEEVLTNVFLMSCRLASAIDDYLHGPIYDFSKLAAALPPLRPAVRAMNGLQMASRKLRELSPNPLRKWRDRWEAAVDEYMKLFIGDAPHDRQAIVEAAGRLSALLASSFPADLLTYRPRIPGSFRSKDLAHQDLRMLGERFVAAFPDREQPILIVGLRTAGSYFAVALRGYLGTQGYRKLQSVTLRPKNGIAPWEAARLASGVRQGALAVVIDEHPNSGGTFAKTARLLRRTGYPDKRIAILFPVHPAHRDWKHGAAFRSLAGIRLLWIEPEEWHKCRLLEPAAVEARLSEYLLGRGYSSVRLADSPSAERWTAELDGLSDDLVLTRLKQIYEVRLERPDGKSETRFILAKSVGWGWLGYHAFLAGARLAKFTPPMLGLRDGILYLEWLPQGQTGAAVERDRKRLVGTVASYVAARVRTLRLSDDPSPTCSRQFDHQGYRVLADLLSSAYQKLAILKAGRLRREASATPCPFPTLIDGQMSPSKWIQASGSLLKTDFEHHGLGKSEMNMTDPAYDLAGAILSLNLSLEEEQELLGRYRQESGDVEVEKRLFASKLMAAWRAWYVARTKVADPEYTRRHAEFSRRFVDTWNFLTVQTARYCGQRVRKPEALGWHSPLAVLDVDGVLDRNAFGYPSTTAAGIRALSLLHAHDIAVAIDTARSLWEVKQYCQAYGLAGGVAEYGSALWDAVDNRELVLVSAEALEQLEMLRTAIREIPGVFLNDAYRHSVRAFTYDHGRPVPLPGLMIQDLLSGLGLNSLRFQNTNIDTTVLAKGIDKGAALRALLDWIGLPGLEVAAVGDSAPDLAMFRVAKRSFAPAQIWCRPEAEQLGCRVAKEPYQRGLLSIARMLAHPNGGLCELCSAGERPWAEGEDLFLDLLEVADQTSLRKLCSVLLDRYSLEAFKQG